MQHIFNPKSVAVVGVSSSPDNLGKNITLNLIDFGFNGIVYAVGPKGGTIATRRIYKSVLDIPDHIDLAVILVPAKFVPEVLEECGQKGVRRLIIETAGFREFSEEGRIIEERMVEIAQKYDIRFIGPNCIGVINMENGFCVPFPRLKPFIRPGEVSIISQSGGVGLSIMNHMAVEGIGLNKFVSVGNVLNIEVEELLDYFIKDKGTKIIFIYLESITNGRRLIELARQSAKPILIFKSNIGVLSKAIALSHTASLSSDDRVVDSAFKQSGITRIHDITTLSNYLKTLRLPPLKGKRLALISRSGGHAIMAADACELTGFDLAELPEPFIREIEKHFRASVIKLTNPLDLGDLFDLDVYYRIVEETLKQKNVDGVVFLHTSLSQTEHDQTTQLIGHLSDLCNLYQKPVAVYVSAESEEIDRLRKRFDFPIFTYIVETFRALQLGFDYAAIEKREIEAEPTVPFEVDKEKAARLIQKAGHKTRDLLLNEAYEVLQAYGITCLSTVTATSAREAVEAAEKIGYPVALKVVSGQISHKSDVGGVQLNLRNGEAVTAAYEDMMKRIGTAYPEAVIESVLVQSMAVGGRELILGGRRDKQFGPIVLVGMGGIFVEIFDQAVIRVAPISHHEAETMLKELGGAQILTGVRGQRPFDLKAVVEAIIRLSQLLIDFPEIQELDINPLRVFHEQEGCLALDARIIL